MNKETFEIIKPFLVEGSTIDNWAVDYKKTEKGLIDPNGIFYPCKKWEHSDLAVTLGCFLDELEKQGWLHIYSFDPVENYCCNKSQLGTLFEFYKANDKEEEFKLLIEYRDSINNS